MIKAQCYRKYNYVRKECKNDFKIHLKEKTKCNLQCVKINSFVAYIFKKDFNRIIIYICICTK